MSAAVPADRGDALQLELEVASIRGLVQILCDARLLAIVAILLRGVLQDAGSAMVLILLAVPLSWLPLRYWTRRPDLFHRSRWFAVIDAVVGVLVIATAVAASGAWELGVVYLFLSAGLAGGLARRGTAVLATALMCAATALVLTVVAVDPLWTAFISACAVGMAYAAAGLSRQLRQQGVLARRLLSAREATAAQDERATLAREMHDSLAKTLHGVELLVTVLAEDLDAEGSGHRATAEQARAACATARLEARQVLSGLRTTVEEGIGPLVRLDVRRWSEHTSIPATVAVHPLVDELELPGTAVYQLDKVLGELLENVSRHAQASRVSVAVETDGTEAALSVTDDGVGLGRRPQGALLLGGHYGLLGVEERMRLLGGSVLFTDGPEGRGTTATVRLPVARRTEERSNA